MIKTIANEEKSKSPHENILSVGVRQNILGVSWDVITDEFYFNVNVSDVQCTNRKKLFVTNFLLKFIFFVKIVSVSKQF